MRWAIFASGEGTNLQNVLDLEASGKIRHQIVCVHANRQCQAIERAKKNQKPWLVLSPQSEDYSEQVLKFLLEHRVEAIFLLGYMKILSRDFLKRWGKLVVNLHPSLLPKYKGLNAIERALEAKEDWLGVTIHEVNEELDSGKMLKQLKFKADYSKAVEILYREVRALEFKIVTEFLSAP